MTTDTKARTARTGVQGGVAYALVSLLSSFVHLTTEQFGAVLVVVGMVVAYLQNAAENNVDWFPALFKSKPPADPNPPVVDA